MTNHGLDHGVNPNFHRKKPFLSDVTDNVQYQRGSLYHSSWTVNLARVEFGPGAGSSIMPPILIHPMKTGMSSLMMKVPAFESAQDVLSQYQYAFCTDSP